MKRWLVGWSYRVGLLWCSPLIAFLSVVEGNLGETWKDARQAWSDAFDLTAPTR